MRKSFYLLLSVAVLSLFSCENEGKNQDPTTPPDPVTEYDPNGEADFTISFCVTDSMAMYMDLGVVDSLHPNLDCSNFTQRTIDTTKVNDKAIYKLFQSRPAIDADKLVIVELPIRLKAGAYEFYLTGKRNSEQITAPTLTVAMARYMKQLDPKVDPEIFTERASVACIDKDPNKNLAEWFRVNSRMLRISFEFQVLK